MIFPEIACPKLIEGFAWVYILQSVDGAFYVGHTYNVTERLRKHRFGIGSKFTDDHRGVRLIFVEGPLSHESAVTREAQLKRWSRAKKEALLEGDFNRLHALSQSRETAKLPNTKN
jgi:putative endonuclease